MERATEKVTVKVKSDFSIDRNGRLHDAAGRFVAEFREDTERAFARLASPGGPFSKIGEGLADAVGAGFNVSGKSPLIMVLIPAIGAIAALIAAALQAANALVAVLAAMPALLTAIGLQAGVVMLAFDGMGTAIQGAFSAKNATELYEAIKNLTPAGQDFVRSLLPLRDMFRDFKTIAQQNFFAAFGDTLTRIADTLGPVLLNGGIAQLATALGGMFRQLGLFFASPTFVTFVKEIIPATVRWLGSFGPGFVQLMTSIFEMARASIPFLERLGQVVGNAFATFSKWLDEQVKSGALTDWLDRMGDTLDHVAELFFKAADFVASFLDALDKAGGNDIIDQFADLFDRMAKFFESEAGQAAMEGFVHLVEALTYAFSGLIFTIFGLLIAFEAVLQFFQFIGAKFMELIDWLTGPASEAIAKFFTEDFPGWVSDLANDVAEWFGKISYYIQSGIGMAVDWVTKKWNELTDWLAAKVAGIINFFTGLPDRLAQIGRDIMDGLWKGLQWGWDHTVKPLLEWITSQIPSWKGPEERDRKLLEPAGQAVMEGFGKGLSQGAEQLRSMLGDFTNSIGDVGYRGAEVGGMPINVNVGFHGALPTEKQAYDTGVAAGQGVADGFAEQVSQRNTRLAVRVA